MGPRRNGHREAPTGGSYDALRSRLRTERWKAKVDGVTNLHVPDRGTPDTDTREVFEGFDSMKLAEQILSDAALYKEQSRPSYYDGSNIPALIKTFPGTIFLTRDHLGPDLVESGNIKSVGWGKMEGTAPKNNLPGDTHYGKVKARKDAPDDMDWGAQSIPKPALPALSASDVGAPTAQAHKALKETVEKLRKKVNKMGGGN
jgi:hypothetical protein